MLYSSEPIYVVQKFIKNPLLFLGFKFDLRVYALITSCNPLTMFIYHDGLAFFGFKQFQLEIVDHMVKKNKAESTNNNDSSFRCYSSTEPKITPETDKNNKLSSEQQKKMEQLSGKVMTMK